PLAELLAEPGGGLARAGEQQHPADRLVEPVDDAEEHVPRFAVLLLEVRLGEPIDRLVLAVEVGGGPPGRLVQRQAVVVLVEDVEAVGDRHAHHHSGSGRGSKPTSSSKTRACRNKSDSRVGLTSWRQIGKPSSSYLMGSETTGAPMKLQGELNN